MSPALTRWKFQKRLPESTHQARFRPKTLKRRVQNLRHFPEKFENRLLGPTISFHSSDLWRLRRPPDVSISNVDEFIEGRILKIQQPALKDLRPISRSARQCEFEGKRFAFRN